MCGIAGLWTREGGVREAGGLAATAEAMADALRHRGPDDGGVWADEAAGIALAHRRLAIIDLSPAGHQPMVSASERYVLTYNGEIYNFEEIRAELEREEPHDWAGYSDTEVLLEAIARWGIERALRATVGMFALALWDRLDRTLTLARDRLGEKPLYYGRAGDALAFASELKAFGAVSNFQPEVDRGALALLLRHNCVPAPYTIYRGVSKVRPGQYIVLDHRDAVPKARTYWSAREAAIAGHENSFKGDRGEVLEELDRLLRQALKGQMISDVPLGAFLSGGIDSSTVVAMMQEISSRPVRSFAIGSHQKDYDEAMHAKAVAKHLGTDHTELYVSERDALDIIPELAQTYCEPFSDSSQIPTLLVSRLARQSVTVSLSGDGGDELFSGYTRYALTDSLWRGVSKVPAGLRRAAGRMAGLPQPAIYDALAGLVNPVLPEHRRIRRAGDKIHKAAGLLDVRSQDELYRRLVSHWADPEALVIDGREPATILTELDDTPEFESSVERMMYQDLIGYLPDDILVKVDRAAMSVGLEARVPLLDHRVVEFSMRLPLSILRHNGQAKWPLRALLSRHVPREMMERPKMGFAVPIHDWLRGPLRDWAEDLISIERLKRDGFFHPAPIRQAWQAHLTGRRNLQYPLWDVLMFQAWRASSQDS